MSGRPGDRVVVHLEDLQIVERHKIRGQGCQTVARERQNLQMRKTSRILWESRDKVLR